MANYCELKNMDKNKNATINELLRNFGMRVRTSSKLYFFLLTWSNNVCKQGDIHTQRKVFDRYSSMGFAHDLQTVVSLLEGVARCEEPVNQELLKKVANVFRAKVVQAFQIIVSIDYFMYFWTFQGTTYTELCKKFPGKADILAKGLNKINITDIGALPPTRHNSYSCKLMKHYRIKVGHECRLAN